MRSNVFLRGRFRRGMAKTVWGLLVFAVGGLLTTGAYAKADEAVAAGILGKDQWLFYRYELTDSSDRDATLQSIALIGQFNKVLKANGVTLAVAMVPIKMRIYSEHLPDGIQINPYMDSNYSRMVTALAQAGVHVIDLNTPFLNHPQRLSPSPLFYRLDTHWSLAGAMAAAEVVKAEVDRNPALRSVVAKAPIKEYSVAYGSRKIPSAGRDLIEQLPTNSIKFPYEQITPVSVTPKLPVSTSLIGHVEPPSIALLGSSYSKDWTGFADGLRYYLQRDVFSMGIGADQGSWVAMETYLRDDSYQNAPPKLLIWEMPERDMRAPPDFRYREARYQRKNSDWLHMVAAWAQASCAPSGKTVRFLPHGIGARANRANEVRVAGTERGDFVELEFDPPLSRFDYLGIDVRANGAHVLSIEAMNDSKPLRRWDVAMVGDDGKHSVKIPLPQDLSPVSRIRVAPGKTSGFSMAGPVVCTMPEHYFR